MIIRLNMVDLPIVLGSIENDNERTQLEQMLRGQGMTLNDVEVVSIDQAEARGYFQNQIFLQHIRMIGFETAAQMRAAAEMARQRGGGNALGGGGVQGQGGNPMQGPGGHLIQARNVRDVLPEIPNNNANNNANNNNQGGGNDDDNLLKEWL